MLNFVSSCLDRAYCTQLKVLSILNFFIPYFKGKGKLLSFYLKFLNPREVTIRHFKGFYWQIDSWHAQDMYVKSCETFTSKVLIHYFAESEIFFDIGANRGWYTYLLSSKTRSKRFFAFEPHPRIFSLLEKNRDINTNLRNNPITLFKLALGNNKETAYIHEYLNSNDGTMTLFPVNGIGCEIKEKLPIEVDSFDNHFNLFKINEDSGGILIKMDIEGSEYEAILGSSKFYAKFRPIVVCEINSTMLKSSGSNSTEVFEFFRSRDYLVMNIDERGFLQKFTAGEVPPHEIRFGENHGGNYLFIPKENKDDIKFKVVG
jgi:FkbM family methyltransferase